MSFISPLLWIIIVPRFLVEVEYSESNMAGSLRTSWSSANIDDLLKQQIMTDYEAKFVHAVVKFRFPPIISQSSSSWTCTYNPAGTLRSLDRPLRSPFTCGVGSNCVELEHSSKRKTRLLRTFLKVNWKRGFLNKFFCFKLKFLQIIYLLKFYLFCR